MVTVPKFVEVNNQITTEKNGRSNNESPRFTSKKKTTNAYLVADDGEVMEITHRENIP